ITYAIKQYVHVGYEITKGSDIVATTYNLAAPAYFSPIAIASLCNKELHHSEPKVLTYTELCSKWIIALPKPQKIEDTMIIDTTRDNNMKEVQDTCIVIEHTSNIDFPWNKEWALYKNLVYGNRDRSKQMSDTVKKMLEQMFLQRNIHAKDRINAANMYSRLKEFADNRELEQDEISKVSTIQE
ncbi:11709_t:CDS:2, partial [Scutellospora calospora]